jgi:hypothetical protein
MSDAPTGSLLSAIGAMDSGDYADASTHLHPTV